MRGRVPPRRCLARRDRGADRGRDRTGAASPQIVDPPSWTKLPGTALDWGYAYQPVDRGSGPSHRDPAREGARRVQCDQRDALVPGPPGRLRRLGGGGRGRLELPGDAALPAAQRGLGGRRDPPSAARAARCGSPGRRSRTRSRPPWSTARPSSACPRLDDANAGENCGAALANLNIAEGRRFSAVDGYLPAWAPPPAPGQVPVGAWTHAPDPPANLTVLTGSTAVRLGFTGSRGDGDGTAAARCSTPCAGRCARPAARTAVVLALGAFGTPELLIRSGIGDPADLGRLGVPVRAALPGVGANLQDHPLVMGVNFRARQPPRPRPRQRRRRDHELAQLAARPAPTCTRSWSRGGTPTRRPPPGTG